MIKGTGLVCYSNYTMQKHKNAFLQMVSITKYLQICLKRPLFDARVVTLFNQSKIYTN